VEDCKQVDCRVELHMEGGCKVEERSLVAGRMQEVSNLEAERMQEARSLAVKDIPARQPQREQVARRRRP